jgi:hypothetical protein
MTDQREDSTEARRAERRGFQLGIVWAAWCKERKLVCCGFDESTRGLRDPLHPDRDFPGPSYCRDCCPHCPKRKALGGGRRVPQLTSNTADGIIFFIVCSCPIK